MKRLLKQLVVTAAIFGVVTVYATPTIRLSTDGGATWTVITDGEADGAGGDDNGVAEDDEGAGAGIVTFNGSLGANWTANVSTGITKPILGTAAAPEMDLNTVNVSSVGAGTLIIEFSETSYGPTSGNALAGIGGTVNTDAGSSLEYKTFADAGNALFGTGTPLTTQSFGTGPFSGGQNGPSLAGDPEYSLTQRITIVHTGAGVSSANATLTSVPEGGTTLMLLGSGLAALGYLRRKLAIKA